MGQSVVEGNGRAGIGLLQDDDRIMPVSGQAA